MLDPMLSLQLLFAGLIASPLAQQGGAGVVQRIVLPADPIAELVARLERAPVAERSLPAWPEWPAWDGADPGWEEEAPWRHWVELLLAEAHAREADPERRAQLALLAREQRRDSDAWRHLLRCGEHPLVLALFPAFLPGVPADLLAAVELPDGVLLRPALPPATEDPRGTLATLAGRSMEHRGVLVAGALLFMVLRIEGDGVQLDLTHKSGPSVHVLVSLPAPAGVEIALTYRDWEKLEDPRAPIELVLSPDDPAHTLWGRFRSRRDRWPMPSPYESERPYPPRAPLALASDQTTLEPRLQRFAEALSELFDRPCLYPFDPLAYARDRLAHPGAHAGDVFEPIVLHLGGGVDPDRKLAAMISLAEAYALAGAARR